MNGIVTMTWFVGMGLAASVSPLLVLSVMLLITAEIVKNPEWV
jgi:hypothetical protein